MHLSFGCGTVRGDFSSATPQLSPGCSDLWAIVESPNVKELLLHSELDAWEGRSPGVPGRSCSQLISAASEYLRKRNTLCSSCLSPRCHCWSTRVRIGSTFSGGPVHVAWIWTLGHSVY